MSTITLARQLRVIKDESEYRAALISAGAETTSAAMCATEARIEGFTGRLATSHAAYCLKDADALARDAGHAAKLLRRNGRPLLRDDDPTSRITITLPRSLLAAIDAAGSNRSATIARIVAEWMAMRSKK